MNVSEIFEAIKEILRLEKKVEEAIENDQDKKRRKKLHKAAKKVLKTKKDSDLIAYRKLLFKL